MRTFVINIFKDGSLAERLIKQIASHCPDDTIVLIPDDGRLKLVQSGAWTQRYLKAGLESDCDVIIKLDPDTCIWKPFKTPQADWFGTLDIFGGFIRGGCLGMSRATAERVVQSKLLLNPDPSSYQRYGSLRWPHEEFDPTPISLQDHVLARVMRKLGINPTNWDDILILGNSGKIPEPGNFAITHPHPTL